MAMSLAREGVCNEAVGCSRSILNQHHVQMCDAVIASDGSDFISFRHQSTCALFSPSVKYHHYSIFFYLPLVVKASSLTTTIAPNERVCFYADVDKAGEKIRVTARFMCLWSELNN